MAAISNDPFSEGYKGPGDISPTKSKDAHVNSDVDSSVLSMHHTLGNRKTQAATGDHLHNGVNGLKLTATPKPILTGAKAGNVALTNLIAMLGLWIDFTDNTT